MSHTARERILRSINHPVTIGAMLLLMVNDHVLRQLWPSWVTGKIGDVAWLIFAPFIAALFLSLVMPQHERATIKGGIVGVAALFIAGNTIPAARDAIISMLNTIFARPFQLAVDPTDLIALPSLSITWMIWKDVERPKMNGTALGWGWLTVGAILTIANSGAPNLGVTCVYVTDSTDLGTSTFTDSYYSIDGGLSWESNVPESIYRDSTEDDCHFEDRLDTPLGLFEFDTSGISRSSDGGQTWEKELNFRGTQARYVYYERYRPEAYNSFPDVFHAIYDEESGHIIVAMGQDGMLVRVQDGSWQWVGVGPYVHENVSRPDKMLRLLWVEFLITVPIAALAVHVGSQLGTKRTWKRAEIGGTLILTVLLIAATIFGPALSFGSSGYGLAPISIGLSAMVGLVSLSMIPVFIKSLKTADAHDRLRWLQSVGIVWALCTLAYVGWGAQIINSYHASVGLVWLTALLSIFAIRRTNGTNTQQKT